MQHTSGFTSHCCQPIDEDTLYRLCDVCVRGLANKDQMKLETDRQTDR